MTIKIFQIVMCTSVRPDFNAEEMASVAKNQRELQVIVEDMADHLPIEDPTKGNNHSHLVLKRVLPGIKVIFNPSP